jgi:uncharacterized protein (DUF2236 family)
MTAAQPAQPVEAVSAAPPNFDPGPYMDGVAAFLGGTANVIMQLSLRPVGYGVYESKVDSGKVMLHPIKRLRTTITYLSVALAGTDDERIRYRDAVNTSHRQVKSGPNSPVKYNAFDPKLQLWVAASLYWGFADLVERMHGPLDDETAEDFYQYCARLGTTLQMRQDMWPADRAAFEQYWSETIVQHHIDPTIRQYFNDLIDLKMLPRPIRLINAPVHRFFVTGLLPPHVRNEMKLTWSDAQERRLNRILRIIGAINRRLPGPIRKFPMNFYLADMRIRSRFNRPLV